LLAVDAPIEMPRRNQMREAIGSGTILIKEGTLLPEALRLETESFVNGWTLVKNLDGYGLDRRIREAGWTYFCLAGEISAIGFGFGGQETERRAVRRLLANAQSEDFNSLEITRMVSRYFLGVPYTTVYAHSRHLQKSLFLFRGEGVHELIRPKISSGVNPDMGRAEVGDLSLEGAPGEPKVATA
jgi:hypothetical protein